MGTYLCLRTLFSLDIKVVVLDLHITDNFWDLSNVDSETTPLYETASQQELTAV